jgi:hypothetical protein
MTEKRNGPARHDGADAEISANSTPLSLHPPSPSRQATQSFACNGNGLPARTGAAA